MLKGESKTKSPKGKAKWNPQQWQENTEGSQSDKERKENWSCIYTQDVDTDAENWLVQTIKVMRQGEVKQNKRHKGIKMSKIKEDVTNNLKF